MRPWNAVLWTAGQRAEVGENALLTDYFDYSPANFEPLGRGAALRPEDVGPDFDFRVLLPRNVLALCEDAAFKNPARGMGFYNDVLHFVRERLQRDYNSGEAFRMSPAQNPGWEERVNSVLTGLAGSGNIAPVKLTLPLLLKRLNSAVQPSGKMTELADYLGAPLTSVSRWLSGNREPGGETTLMMLHWVEQQERQQTKALAVLRTPPGPKTRLRKSDEEKPKPSPPKR